MSRDALRTTTGALVSTAVVGLLALGAAHAAGATDRAGTPPDRVALASAGTPAGEGTRVLAISVDGLNPKAVKQLGRRDAPAFFELLDHGASTLNARTEVEATITLPNHTGMMTGRRVEAAQGGHGVTWDDDRPGTTVQAAAGHDVSSVFRVVHEAGGSTALFSTKPKFGLYQRSWPDAIDRFHTDERQTRLVRAARHDLVHQDRELTFLHLSLPDRAGHASGFLSEPYRHAVDRTDHLVGTLLRAVHRHPALAEDLVVVLTADHGGPAGKRSHSFAHKRSCYRVPFLVWGAGVTEGDLYDLNPDYADPGREQPSYDGPQPVRNTDLADLATGLLGLGPVPGSELDAGQDLDVTGRG